MWTALKQLHTVLKVVFNYPFNYPFTVKTDVVISVYLPLLPVAHLSDAPRRRLVITEDSARIQDETTENSIWFFNVLGVKHRHMGPRFNVSSERQLVFLVDQPWFRTHNM